MEANEFTPIKSDVHIFLEQKQPMFDTAISKVFTELLGFVENSMNGSYIRTIEIARAKAKLGLMNLTYNICRCIQLKIAVPMG